MIDLEKRGEHGEHCKVDECIKRVVRHDINPFLGWKVTTVERSLFENTLKRVRH